ncbi:SMI1/KNR4 family protein [Allorhizocola rhizosphaerae]|uniref:SMI1/KNR4 family protein n=1 Tax=Allorhizocola rhizosphaerae TaxID=1872709 RepID=UPI001B8D8F54|nr:SMI1/KNR4 family protein [Allorhizocola rhizosphaerae]
MTPFEQVAGTFWDTAVSYGVLAPLTPGAVITAERQLGVKLPGALVQLLQIQNGGAVADAWSECSSEPNFYAEDCVPFDHLFGIGPATDTGATTLLDTPYLVQEWDLPPGVVLLSGQGHYWVALDYRTCGTEGEPTVTWIDNEMDHELHLASNFRTFVENLMPATHLR